MTSTVASAPVSASGRHRVPPARFASRLPWLVAVGLVGLALGVRLLGLTTANDLFIDEVTYSQLAAQLAGGTFPSIFGVPFFLHPPGGLLIDAGAIRAFGMAGPALDLALGLRWVHAVLGTVVVLVGYLLVRRVAGLVPGAAAGLVLVFDPFVLRIDTRVMLETSMTLWLLVGTLVLVGTLDLPQGRRRAATELATGVIFGLAVFSKDMIAVPIAVLLVLAVLVRRTLPLRAALRICATLPLPYLAYLGLVAGAGLMPRWWEEKASGLARMTGHSQQTGFNMPGAPSLVSRLLDQLVRFGTSYVLIAACTFVGLAVAWWGRSAGRRIVGMLATGCGLLGLYAAAAGTLEEQFGYPVVVASALAAAVGVREIVERGRFRAVVLTVVGVFLVATAATGIHARLVVDDGYRQVRDWTATALPAGARVGVTGVTGEFALVPRAGWGVWPSLASLAANHADYVVTQSATLSQGYGFASPTLLTWLQAHAVPVFRFDGPSNGHTVVWQLDRAALAAAVARGESVPPVTGGYP